MINEPAVLVESYPYEAVVDAAEVAMDDARVQKVVRRFCDQQHQGAFPGGQLVARRGGKVVVKVHCGVARGWQGRGGSLVDVQETTPFAVFSTGKPMAAVIIALLESRGLLDITSPVSSILPEFATLGRQDITVVDVLTHRAGIILPGLINRPGLVGDAQAVWQYLLETAPKYPRGTFAYMPIEYGIILDQLVMRLTTKSIALLLQDELITPLGLNNMQYGLGAHALDELAWAYWLGESRYMIVGADVADEFEAKNNSLDVFSAANPAMSMVADAANLAAFYEFLTNSGCSNGDRRFIDAARLKQYTTCQVAGWNKSVNTYLSIGNGFMLGALTPSFFGWWGSSGCYGHGGMFSSMAFADRDTGLSMAIVTNGNRGLGDLFKRMASLAHTLRRACR